MLTVYCRYHTVQEFNKGVYDYIIATYESGLGERDEEDIEREETAEEGDDEEKEAEKRWMDEHMGFVGEWRDGFVMYDGTIVVLFSRPGKDGDAYYTRKSNYGLNVQVI